MKFYLTILQKRKQNKPERETITFYKSDQKEFGYNMTTGGIGGGRDQEGS